MTPDNRKMLAIIPLKKQASECVPNVIPAKVNYDGPVNASSQHWQPEDCKDGSKTAYFRGRKLKGRNIKMPDGYTGAVLVKTDTLVQPAQSSAPILPPGYYMDRDMEDEEIEGSKAKVLEQVATFSEVAVWGHDSAPSTTVDVYTKAIEEWIEFADTMHKLEPENTLDFHL